MFPLGLSMGFPLGVNPVIVVVNPDTKQLVYPELVLQIDRQFNTLTIDPNLSILTISPTQIFLTVKESWQTLLMTSQYRTFYFDQYDQLVEIHPYDLAINLTEYNHSALIDTQAKTITVKFD